MSNYNDNDDNVQQQRGNNFAMVRVRSERPISRVFDFLMQLREVLHRICHLSPQEQNDTLDTEITQISLQLSLHELESLLRMFTYETRVTQLQQRLQFRVPPKYSPPAKQTKVIKIADLAVVNPNTCAICMDNHCRGEEIDTNCGHRFGATCFANWEATQLKTTQVKCPCCRTVVSRVIGYRRRALPKSKQNVCPPKLDV